MTDIQLRLIYPGTTEGRRRHTGTHFEPDTRRVFVWYAERRIPMATVRRFKAHPQSAPGDFYVVNGECISCGAPHAVAPDLIGWATNIENEHCIWKKQPETPEELEQALAAFDASEIGCYRYAGNDPMIMARIGPGYCDQAAPTRKTQSLGNGGLSANHPIPVTFTLSVSQQTSVFSRLVRFLASLFKHK